MPDHFRFDAATTFSIHGGSRDQWVEARWRLGPDERLSIGLSRPMVERVRALGASFTRAEFERAIGDRATAARVLRRLRAHGLIRHLSPAALHTTALRVPDGAVRLAYRSVSLDADGDGIGTGIDVSARNATRAARCEAVERRGLLRPDLARPEPEQESLRSLEMCKGLLFDYLRAVAPISCDTRPGARDRVACQIATGRVSLLPSPWIYIGASSAANTNGCAFGHDLASALKSATNELIERNTLLRAWYGLAPSRALSTRELARPAIAHCSALAAAQDLRVQWFVLGRGRPITVACVLNGRRASHLGLGSATRPSVEAAATKAFFEAAGSHLGHLRACAAMGQRRFVRLRRAWDRTAPADLHRNAFEAYWACDPVASATAISARFTRPGIRGRQPLARSGFCWVDVTPRGTTDGRVVKVFHPDAVPLPNTLAQAMVLERALGVRGDGTPPPIS